MSRKSKLNELIEYILKKYSMKAKWKIIFLPLDKWKKLQMDQFNLGKEHERLEKLIEKAIEAGELNKLENSQKELVMKKFQESLSMEKVIIKEYGKELSYEEYLMANATTIIDMDIKPFEIENKTCPFITKLKRENSDRDFIILINKLDFSKNSRREQLVTIAHEVTHYVLSNRGEHKTHEDIENMSNKIVDEFSYKI